MLGILYFHIYILYSINLCIRLYAAHTMPWEMQSINFGIESNAIDYKNERSYWKKIEKNEDFIVP